MNESSWMIRSIPSVQGILYPKKGWL